MNIVYETENGLEILHPVYPEKLYVSVEEMQETLKHVFEKDVPEKYKHTVKYMKPTRIPKDRLYRNSWKLQEEDIVEDLEKAKNIHKDRLRRERTSLLADQDIRFMKALEDGESTADIVAEKKRLRDITKLVDNVKDTIELRQITLLDT